MEINTDNSVGPLGVGSAGATPELKSNDKENPAQPAVSEEENPDFKVDISKESIEASSKLNENDQARDASNVISLNSEEATQLASQTGKGLAGLDHSIASQSARKALDIFG